MKNKFGILLSLITMAAILLAGCSDAAAATVPTSTGLSTASMLALGTLKLEGTSQVVTATQASQLLTLWEGYQSISQSDTCSQVELDEFVINSNQLNTLLCLLSYGHYLFKPDWTIKFILIFFQ